jgi:hypothetical protein
MKHKLKSYLPLLISLAVCLISCIMIWIKPGVVSQDGSITNYSLPNNLLIGLFSLIVISVFVLIKKKIWSVLFLCFSVLYVFDFVSFSATVFYFRIGSLTIPVIPVLLICLHLAFNSELLVMLKLKSSTNPIDVAKEKEQQKANFEAAVQMYLKKWADKSQYELESIIEQKAHVDEAIEAAKRLVESLRSKQNG